MIGRSGDDIGKQLVFDLRNAVLEDELFLFQSLYKELVSQRIIFKRHNLAVELSVLGPQVHQLFPELAFVTPLHRKCPTPARPLAAFWAIAFDLATGKREMPQVNLIAGNYFTNL